MWRKMPVLLVIVLLAIGSQIQVTAQSSSSRSKARTAENQPKNEGTPFVFKRYSRMVNLDVVVEDSKGNHIRGLNAGDFEIYEQTRGRRRDKREQKIAAVREVHVADMTTTVDVPSEAASEAGVYTNAVTVQKDPVPLTVLLVDGLNTEIQYQGQVHEQMLRMLKQLPPNVPVAVFLMGVRLKLLQGFTTDPHLLQAALAKAESVTGQGLGHLDPQDIGSAPGNQLYGMHDSGAGADQSLGDMIAGIQGFDQAVYAANVRERIDRTYTAFLSIARSLSGIPGRKNVLWLSTSFPLTLNLFMRAEDASSILRNIDMARVNHLSEMRVLDNVLSEAKIAVYPVDIGGVRTLHVFSASAMPANPYATPATAVDGQRVAAAQSREIQTQFEEQNTMRAIAKDTGGKVCIGDNDLGDCIRKAMNDSSDFYEISYYPDSSEWNGEYRKVSVKVKEHGARLSYRQGYYATKEGNSDTRVQAAEMWKDCDDLLNATGIVLTARNLPADESGKLKFSLEINPSTLTFTPTLDGRQEMNVEIGVCTFDQKGWPQKLVTYPLHLGLDQKAYHTLIDGGRLRDLVYVPEPKRAAVRLMVKDIPSGRLGSIYIQKGKIAAAPSQSAKDSAAQGSLQ